jgi:endonuclease/exonuclease/phosphatase family metal-dependent hydrolase
VTKVFRWCRAVGPLALYRPERPQPPAVDSLAIVSWNIHVGGGAVVDLIDSLGAGSFTGGRPVEHFVLLLQETFREGGGVPEAAPDGSGSGRARFNRPPLGGRLDITRVADSLGLFLFYVPSMRNGRGAGPRGLPEDRGNAILSTVPLTRLTVVELPFFGQRRVAQLATIAGRTARASEWRLQLANVHFDIGQIGPAALSAGRARQARAVAQVADTGAVVLGGDLNAFTILGTSASVQILREAFPQSVQADSAPTHRGMRIDYLFYRLPPEYRGRPYHRLGSAFGSDHYPLLGWVLFE